MHSIDYWIHKRAEINPDRTALIGETERYTYRELSQKVKQMAHFLKKDGGLKKGERVAILSKNREEYIMAYFAIAELGLVAVPLNIRLNARELAFQVEDSGAKTILYERDMEELFLKLSGLANFENAFLWEELTAPSSQVVEEINTYEIHQTDDPFIICYTSGTTGRPKGAVLTHENIFWNALNNQYAIDLTSQDKTIVILPLFHIGGIGLFAFPTLLAGGTIIVPRTFDPEQVIHWIEVYKITVVMGVPTIHNAIRKASSFETANFESVRWFYSGGAPCPNELIHDFLDRGLTFGQGFGMTETSPTVFMISKEDYRRKAGSIGKPVTFCDIKIVDDNGRPVKEGEVGELLIKGPNVMKEYWGLPEETAETKQDGWLHSGDLARQDEEGFIYIAGRRKEMIISGGENIYPLEVEQLLDQLAPINEAAVVGRPDEKWGEVPVAFVSFHDGTSMSAEEIREFCKRQLAKYKVPNEVVVFDELPKNATGKINKQAILKHMEMSKRR